METRRVGRASGGDVLFAVVEGGRCGARCWKGVVTQETFMAAANGMAPPVPRRTAWAQTRHGAARRRGTAQRRDRTVWTEHVAAACRLPITRT